MSYIGNSPGVASQRVTTTLTATAGQTQFTTQSGYVLGYVDVYLNGAKLVNGSDFEAITGTYITLFAGAAVGDVVELVSYVPRGLSDGYTKAEADAKFLDVGGDTATGAINLGANGLVVGTNQLVASGGFVGIGTASPTVKLHLEGAANSAPVTLLRLNNAGSASGGPGIASRISFTVGASSLGFIQGSNYATGATGLQFSGDGTNAQLLLDSTGNIGIGTISPTTKLQVSHVGDLASAAVVIGDQATPASITGIYLRSTTKANINFSNGGVLAFNGAGDGSAERMRIDANGNVGINITTPGAKLDVQSGTNPAVVIRNSYTFAGSNYHLRIIGDGTSNGYITQLPAQGGLSLADGMRYYGAGPWVPDAGITAASAINQLSGNITFTTNSITANTNFTPTERMRIDSTGRVGIGTSSPAYTLDVNGQVNFAASVYHRVGGSPIFAASGGYNYFYNNTGGTIWRNSADTLEYMRLDSSGNFFVGTTTGSAKLNVGASSGAAASFYAPSGTTQQNSVQFVNSTNSSYVAIAGAGTSSVVPTWNSGAQIIEFVPYSTGDSIISAYTGNLTLQTNGRTERMRITSGGLVGIGTNNPGTLLDIQNAGTATINVKSTSANGGAGLTLDTGATAGYSNQIVFANTGTSKWALGGKDIGSASGDKFSLYNYTAGANFFTIDTAGRTGIGTVSPTAQLTIQGTGGSGWLSGARNSLHLKNSNASGNQSCNIVLGSAAQANYWEIGNDMAANGNDVNVLYFYNGSASAERMRIDASGNLLVGTTSTANALPNGHVKANGFAGNIKVSITALNTNYIFANAINGLVLIRDDSTGGTDLWLIDPNMGNAKIYGNITKTLVFTYISGYTYVKQTSGSVTSNYSMLVLNTQ